VLQISALLERLSQVLSTFRLDVVTLETQAQQAGRFRNKFCQRLRAEVSDFIVSEVDLLNVNREVAQRFAQDHQLFIVNTIGEVPLVISLDDDVDLIIFVVGLLKISNECFMRLDVGFFAGFLVDFQYL
jgi:hypothetical protein